MTPERAAQLVDRWVRFYTQGLPTPIAGRRLEEIRADIDDHTALERAQDTSDRHIALSILSRMARGLIADVSWRRQIRPLKGDLVKPNLPILALGGGLGVAAIVFGEADDAPGLVLLGLLIIGGALVFGLAPALRSKSRVLGFVVAAIAVTAIGSVTAGWLENNF